MRRCLPGKGPSRIPSTRRSTWRQKAPLVEAERANYDFFLELPELQRAEVVQLDHKAWPRFLEPLFEYSGACAGCGETPYLKLLTQLFGDRLLIANATGCSSIYGGDLPATPYTTNREGRGPALGKLALRGQRRVWLWLPPCTRRPDGRRPTPSKTTGSPSRGCSCHGAIGSGPKKRSGDRGSA